MSTATLTKRKSFDYGWDDLQPGESHFKFGRDPQRMRDAWKAYQRKHPEMAGVVMDFEEIQRGVIYKRLK